MQSAISSRSPSSSAWVRSVLKTLALVLDHDPEAVAIALAQLGDDPALHLHLAPRRRKTPKFSCIVSASSSRDRPRALAVAAVEQLADAALGVTRTADGENTARDPLARNALGGGGARRGGRT